MVKKVVIDSDAIYAIYNPNDSLHPKVIETLKGLKKHHFQLIYPSSVIFEVISLFQRVLSKPKATTQLIEMLKQNQIQVYVVDLETLKESAALFKPTGSKKNTLIDCSVAVITKKIKADGVFSYDEFYAKQGIKSAEDVIKYIKPLS